MSATSRFPAAVSSDILKGRDTPQRSRHRPDADAPRHIKRRPASEYAFGPENAGAAIRSSTKKGHDRLHRLVVGNLPMPLRNPLLVPDLRELMQSGESAAVQEFLADHHPGQVA